MPLPKSDRWTDQRRKTRQEYDAKQYSTVGAKLRRADADLFRAACVASGTTPSAVLSRAALDYIAANAAPDQQQTPEEE